MNDMSRVIAPKSDQLNSDDLIAGPITIQIRDVDIRPGTEQPVSIFFENDANKPWKPCKSMSRVLVSCWGPDAKVYVGRAVTLYRDPEVTWGGMKVGGIRVSHVSHIDKAIALALTATKGRKAMATIKPLQQQQRQEQPAAAKQSPADWTGDFIEKVNAVPVADALDALVKRSEKALERLKADHPDLHKRAEDAIAKRRADLVPAPEMAGAEDENPFGGDE
jgi:hypothetical protein